ncbi:MAG: class I adenylate-forming enzyme family protein [Actinomycetales bacterium]
MSRPGVARPLLLSDGDAAELTARLWAAAEAGTPVAVLDPAWPRALRRAAEDALDRADLPDGSLVLFTSGSSGRPRGVIRTAASWQASVGGLTDITGVGADDVVWLPGSPTSTMTLYGGWHATAVGAEVRGAEGWPRGAPPAGVTALHAAPRVLAAAVSTAERDRLRDVRVAVVAGAPLPAELRARADGLGWRIVEYYGAAELSFVAWREKTVSYQRFPGVAVEIRASEIWARSAYLCEGYLTPDDDGPLRKDGSWATVGDLGREQDDGLHVLGRGDAAVTTGGRTVVVEEVESAIREHPAAPAGMDDVVVTSIPHPLLGELLVAVVAVAGPPDSTLSRAALDRTVSGLPDWSRPRRWWLVEELPRTSTGKPDRAAVRLGVRHRTLTDRPLR